jgi:hypothetical protein
VRRARRIYPKNLAAKFFNPFIVFIKCFFTSLDYVNATLSIVLLPIDRFYPLIKESSCNVFHYAVVYAQEAAWLSFQVAASMSHGIIYGLLCFILDQFNEDTLGDSQVFLKRILEIPSLST